VLVRDARAGFAGVATLRDQSLSMSGSLGQGFAIEGTAYGHVIDPRSGQPLTRRAVSAVVDASGSRAEALSKALLVLEPDEGIALLETLPGAEGLWLDESGELRESSGWRAAVRFEPLGR
jgi:thiamine biosynthesis lipoprotein